MKSMHSTSLFIPILIIATGLIITSAQSDDVRKATAKVYSAVDGRYVFGTITFQQDTSGGIGSDNVHITGRLSGIQPAPGLHGLHVHWYGDLATSQDCKPASIHWNPQGELHGGPFDDVRHIGDLGNIEVDSGGNANVDMSIPAEKLPLVGPESIIGRMVVLHEGEDDLGQGGQADSKTTGHAGNRLGCGVIGIASNFLPAATPVPLANQPKGTRRAVAKISSVRNMDQNLGGEIRFEQSGPGAPVRVYGSLMRIFPQGKKHGFHIHELGDISDDMCMNPKGHWNPKSQTHGDRHDQPRHIGDLGNLDIGEDGALKFDFNMTEAELPLIGPESIVGRAIMLHKDPDDLGKGPDDESKKTGNAGARLACGVIGIAETQGEPDWGPAGTWTTPSAGQTFGLFGSLSTFQVLVSLMVCWCTLFAIRHRFH